MFFQPYILSFNLGNFFYWFWIREFFSHLIGFSFKVFSLAAISWLNSSAFSYRVVNYILWIFRNTIFPLIVYRAMGEWGKTRHHSRMPEISTLIKKYLFKLLWGNWDTISCYVYLIIDAFSTILWGRSYR